MSRRFRENFGRAVRLLAVFGFLAAAVPGCSEAPKKEEGASPLPPSVQDSNKNMENFMKSQNPKTKK